MFRSTQMFQMFQSSQCTQKFLKYLMCLNSPCSRKSPMFPLAR